MTDPTLALNALGVAAPALSLVSSTKIPNVQPVQTNLPYRIAIIGDSPSADEESAQMLSVGQGAKLLDSVLSGAGILRTACFIGNVCPYRAPNNSKGLSDITEFDEYTEVKGKLRRAKGSWTSHPKVVEGMAELREQLHQFKPNATFVLGNGALHFARGPGFSVDDWRGSIMSSSIGKIVPSFSTSRVLREYSLWPFLRWDALRLRAEGESPVV
jgi:uracil-DNA glycosylase